MSVPNWGLLIGSGGFVAGGGSALAGQVTDNLAMELGIGVTAGVGWMLLCAYTADVIRARRRGDPTSNGDET